MKILWFLDKQFDISLDKSTWLEIIKCLQKNNEILLVTGYKKKKFQDSTLKNNIIYLKSSYYFLLNRLIFSINQINSFKELVSQFCPDVVIFNTKNYFLAKQAVNLKRNIRFKVFLDVRTLPVYSSIIINTLEFYLFKKTLKIAAETFDGITYITDELKNYCQKKFNLSKHKSAIWTSGVNTDLFKPKKIPNHNNIFKVIYHGTIADNRGLENVIKAITLLNDPEIRFQLLGKGNGLNKLKELTFKLKLEKKVIFSPAVSYEKVPEFINKNDVGILPFQSWEAWNTSSPLKLFEYLACGKPVIATKIPSFYNLLKGKRFVFWAGSSSPFHLAQALKASYLARKEFNWIAREALDFVAANFSWQNQADKLEAFINE